MKVINNGNSFHVYDDTVKLYESLPAGIYNINFSQLAGFSLSAGNPIHIDEKVYGIHDAKVNKVLNSFKVFTRNLGIILSGDKGIGKSLFAKMLCHSAVEAGYPVIICDRCYPGIDRFLDSMNQELVVLFDEFDKTFHGTDDNEVQAQLLSLFDGVSMNKKLFCITCNNTSGLNDFLINRPGRFHYHFRFDYPNENDIRVYVQDHVEESSYPEITKIINFAKKVQLNYDCLRAICFELNNGCTFEEAISDLNIIKPNHGVSSTLYVLFEDGSKFKQDYTVDMFDDEAHYYHFGETEYDDDYITVKVDPSMLTWNDAYNGFYMDVKNLEASDDVDERLEDESDWLMRNHKNEVMSHRAANIVGIIVKPNLRTQRNIHYY